MLQMKAVRNLGAELVGQRQEFQIEVELDKQFIKESAMALFSGGRGTLLDIQDRIVVYEQYNDGIIKHIEK